MNDEVVHCPYNFSHIILKPRMAAHLIKCRLQHPTDKFSICPFNSTHDVYAPELQYHIENCEDRKKLDSFIYVTNEQRPKDESDFHIELPPASENWDEETTEHSYLDVKNKVVENQLLFRTPVGMTKSEKKAFFKQEAKRFENITTGKGTTGPQNFSEGPSSSGLDCSRNNIRETEDFAFFLEPRPITNRKPNKDIQVVGRCSTAGRGYKIK